MSFEAKPLLPSAVCLLPPSPSRGAGGNCLYVFSCHSSLFLHYPSMKKVKAITKQADGYTCGQVYVPPNSRRLDDAGNQKKKTSAARNPTNDVEGREDFTHGACMCLPDVNWR